MFPPEVIAPENVPVVADSALPFTKPDGYISTIICPL